jgi:hypothetical protein
MAVLALSERVIWSTVAYVIGKLLEWKLSPIANNGAEITQTA